MELFYSSFLVFLQLNANVETNQAARQCRVGGIVHLEQAQNKQVGLVTTTGLMFWSTEYKWDICSPI